MHDGSSPLFPRVHALIFFFFGSSYRAILKLHCSEKKKQPLRGGTRAHLQCLCDYISSHHDLHTNQFSPLTFQALKQTRTVLSPAHEEWREEEEVGGGAALSDISAARCKSKTVCPRV